MGPTVIPEGGEAGGGVTALPLSLTVSLYLQINQWIVIINPAWCGPPLLCQAGAYSQAYEGVAVLNGL